MDERRLARLAGVALPAAVWLLGVIPAPREGLTANFLVPYTLLLAALAWVDLTAPERDAPAWKRAAWIAAELVLCFLVVRQHGTLIRPALVYLLPASRVLLLYGEQRGLWLSLLVWAAYSLNVAGYAWPDRLNEYPNYLSFFLAPYLLAVLLTLGTLSQTRSRRRVEALYAQLQAAHAELQRLHANAQEQAVTAERNRVAREIHDTLAHYLTVINVQLEAAEKLADGTRGVTAALAQVRRARKLTLECLQEVRRSVAALRAASLEELSLTHALRRLAAEFNDGTGLEVKLDLSIPDETNVSPEVALALYRAAQEGLTNVHRHAGARRATLTLGRENGYLRLWVDDDGRGPHEVETARKTDRFGLQGLRERVALLGGEVGFGAGPGGGSRLSVLVPA